MINISELGIPIECKKLPKFFDTHNIYDDTALTNTVLELLKSGEDVNGNKNINITIIENFLCL